MEGDRDRPPPAPPDPDISDPLSPLPPPYSPLSNGDEEIEQTRRKRPISKDSEDETPTVKSIKTSIGRARYSAMDRPPYLVHVSRYEQESNSGSTMHPIKFGQLLMKLKIANIMQDGIKRVGRNRVAVEFKSPESANAFIVHPELTPKGYLTSIPTYNITRMGMVKEVPPEWSEEDIISNLTVPTGCGKIIKARRINYRFKTAEGTTEWRPSQSVVLTFDGQILPQRVFACYSSLTVELYHFPTIICFNCCRYGHTKTKCRSKPKCFRCGDNHSSDSCSTAESDACCMYCDG
ncbi:unnamed protein product [Plutella xylostella]|uniref:(diamondback moth) hypothetical protein n=1 Tax=Plutella xylostella TaxID=51655 RepID=A0A8S4GB20_PLUXY|nr:unnamed protein product [Plutella xylostella]